MNKVIMMGRLGADPEYRQFDDDKGVTNFRIAVQRPFAKDETDWFSCAIFGKRAEIVRDYFSKGDRILVSGYLRNRSYENRDGVTVTITEINVEDFDFVEKNSGAAEDSKPRPQAPPKKKPSQNEDEVFGAEEDDDEDW